MPPSSTLGATSLEAIEPFIGEVLKAAAPGQRKKLMDKLMRFARRANAERIAANVEPEGGAMAKRKPRKGKRGKMFKRIGKTGSLKIRANPDAGELSFVNAGVEQTAATHHFGLVGFVGKTRRGRIIRTKYEARRLLGHGAEQADYLDEVLKHFSQ